MSSSVASMPAPHRSNSAPALQACARADASNGLLPSSARAWTLAPRSSRISTADAACRDAAQWRGACPAASTALRSAPYRHYPGGVVQRRRMQRGRTVVRTRVNVRSATEQHPHHPAGRLERRHVQGGRAVVRPARRSRLRGRARGPPTPTRRPTRPDAAGYRPRRRAPRRRGRGPATPPPPKPRPPRRRVQRRDALRGRRPDVSPARRENGRSRAAAARGRVVQRGRRCRIGNVRARAALEQNRRGLARRRLRRCGAGSRRSGGTGGIGPGRSSSACSATPGRAARRRSAAARPTALRPPAAPGRRRPVQGGRAVQVRPPVCRPPSTRTTCGRDGRRVPPAT